VKNAKGDFVALIDDDEFPNRTWLLELYKAIQRYKSEGVLAPVMPVYEKEPPRWIVKGKFHEKPYHETGYMLKWQDTRTSNVLIKRKVIDGSENKFDSRFGRGGEDKDFFKRMMDKGFFFVWCNEAPVYEIITPKRSKKVFMLKRALLRGKSHLLYPEFGIKSVVKSLIAIPIYTAAIPTLYLLGQHLLMDCLIRLSEHIGKILYLVKIDIIKQRYVMD